MRIKRWPFDDEVFTIGVMRSLLVGAVVAAALAGSAAAQEGVQTPAEIDRVIAQLRDAAMASDHGYDIVQSLVTEVGPRISGSPAEARARDWAVAMLQHEGFANVHIEPFQLATWDATVERAQILEPGGPRDMVAVALGYSPSTPAGGIDGELVRFTSMAELDAAPEAAVRGRIVYVDEHMMRAQTGAGYPVAVEKRSRCALAAEAKGAIGCLIRSAGTNTNRFAHQGAQRRGAHIPAMAVSPPDADVLTRLMAAHPSVRVRMEVQASAPQDATSGNVIAEIRGRERPNEIVLVAAHLDSWDAGMGAIDDGAGVAIVTAAAKLIRDLPRRPRRTIRILLAGSEENGGGGDKAYFTAHGAEPHVVAAESDFGGDVVWRVSTRFNDASQPYVAPLRRALAPLNVLPGPNEAEGGADIEPLLNAGVAIVDLDQDGTRYFDYHHTPDDTLDKIEPAQLRENVAAWAAMIYLFAETDWSPAGIAKAAP